MSLFRHEEIFRSDMFDWSGDGISAAPGLIGCDEFPAGYSSADCSPAGSASASPTVDQFALKSSCPSILFHRTAYSVLTVCLSPGGHPIRRRHALRQELCSMFPAVGGMRLRPYKKTTGVCRQPLRLCNRKGIPLRHTRRQSDRRRPAEMEHSHLPTQ